MFCEAAYSGLMVYASSEVLLSQDVPLSFLLLLQTLCSLRYAFQPLQDLPLIRLDCLHTSLQNHNASLRFYLAA